MRRRVIRQFGKSMVLEQVKAVREQIAESMRDKLQGLPQDRINHIVEYIRTTGWDAASFGSFAKQNANQHRPPVSAFLFHHEHVIDELIINQGVYTHFHDTAADPNFAVRFPAETELMLRRMSPGDVYLLQAAQHLHLFLGPNDRPAEENPQYWEMLWTQLLEMNLRNAKDATIEALLSNPLEAFFTCERFARQSSERTHGLLFDHAETEHEREFHHTFFGAHPVPSPRYLGITFEEARERVGDRFEQTISLLYSESDQHFWKACCILVCYGIDMCARSQIELDNPLGFGRRHFDFFSQSADRHYNFIKGRIRDKRFPNANSETVDPSSGD